MPHSYADFRRWMNSPNPAPGSIQNVANVPEHWRKAKAASRAADARFAAAAGFHPKGMSVAVDGVLVVANGQHVAPAPAPAVDAEADLDERRATSDRLRRRIAAMRADLQQSIAHANRPRRDLRRWFDLWGVGQTCDWKERDADLWRVALHESAHCVAAISLGLTVESGIARRDGSGDVYVPDSKNPFHTAAMLAAGTESDDMSAVGRGSWRGQPGDDLAQFRETMAKMVDHYGRAASDTGHEASNARDLAESCLKCHGRAHTAIAAFLFDHAGQRVDGADIMQIFTFHESPEHADDRQHLQRYHEGERYRGWNDFMFPG
ncbi:MAG: hypothetical protein NTW19_02745 [Planctomycetota bacterium]|nr:hypothetical protein [Planctomycetota bacterium]